MTEELTPDSKGVKKDDELSKMLKNYFKEQSFFVQKKSVEGGTLYFVTDLMSGAFVKVLDPGNATRRKLENAILNASNSLREIIGQEKQAHNLNLITK